MEKDAFIKTRISTRTKDDFEAICKTIGIPATTKARELIEDFVKAQYGVLNDRLTIHVFRPSDYMSGAWRVRMQLRNPDELEWQGSPVPFELPSLPKRRLHPDDGFLAVVTIQETGELGIGGKFVKGLWEGHLYSNGIEENKNPTSIEQVRNALADTITTLLARFSAASTSKPAEGG